MAQPSTRLSARERLARLVEEQKRASHAPRAAFHDTGRDHTPDLRSAAAHDPWQDGTDPADEAAWNDAEAAPARETYATRLDALAAAGQARAQAYTHASGNPHRDMPDPDPAAAFPAAASLRAAPAQDPSRPISAIPADELISPAAFLQFLIANALRIALLAAVLLVVLFAAYSLVSFPYRSTAVVLVDPREQNITPTQDVLPAIGTDAATLESVVQIVQSGGFLSEVLKTLDVKDDPEIARADPRETLAAFRKKLKVERRGATYLVDITYASADPERAASYANAVAEAFVRGQNGARTAAAENASTVLSARLGELRSNLRASEDAVARYKVETGIIDVDPNSTLIQRQMSDMSQQAALARAAADQAKARYDQALAASGANAGAGIGTDGAGSGLSSGLDQLRRDRSELERQLGRMRQVYGDAHPRIVEMQSQITILDSQIRAEESRLRQGLKQQYEAALQQQKSIEAELARLSSDAGRTSQAMVHLADLERQAAADRAIYEEYLARFKATDEQKLLKVDDVRVVSPAIPPINTSAPSRILVVAIFALLSVMLATLAIFGRAALRRDV